MPTSPNPKPPSSPPHRRTLPDVSTIMPPRLALVGLGTLLGVALLVTFAPSVDGTGRGAAQVALVSFAIFMLYVAVLVGAGGLSTPHRVRRARRSALGYRLAAVLLLALLGMCVVFTTVLVVDLAVGERLSPQAYFSDTAAFNHYDADLVLQGRDPFTCDVCFWDAVRRFPSSGATPVRRGRYQNTVWGPPLGQVQHDVALEAAQPALRGSEFAPESLHSYPALAFLVNVPLVWAGVPSTTPVSIAGWLILIAAIGCRLPGRYRLAGLLILAANVMGALLALRGVFEIAVLLAFLAWYTLDRRWLSATLLGCACAAKQIVWPLAPLYLVLVARRHGWREAGKRAAIALVAFTVPNAPFAIAAPGAWARSLLLPMTLPLFPDGTGLIALAHAGLLPLWSAPVYAALEAIGLLGLVLWVAFRRPAPRPEVVLLVGLLPLALAWRSLAGYFAWLPAFALFATIPLLGKVASSAPAASPVDAASAVITPLRFLRSASGR